MFEITHPRIQHHITEHVASSLVTPLCEYQISQDHEHETPVRKTEIEIGTTG
jgi:hypothetical protein